MEKTIRFTLDAAGLTKINLALLGLSGKQKRTTILTLAALEIFSLLCPVAVLHSTEVDLWTLILSFSLTLILPVLPFYQYVYLPRRLRGTFEKQKTLPGEYTLTFTEEEFLLESPYGNARLPWSVFLR